MLADNKFAEAIFAGLAEMLEHSNPSLLEQVIGIIQQHLFMLYPFELEPREVDVWVNAYYKWANAMYGNYCVISDDVNHLAVEEAISIIEELEIRQKLFYIMIFLVFKSGISVLLLVSMAETCHESN